MRGILVTCPILAYVSCVWYAYTHTKQRKTSRCAVGHQSKKKGETQKKVAPLNGALNTTFSGLERKGRRLAGGMRPLPSNGKCRSHTVQC